MWRLSTCGGWKEGDTFIASKLTPPQINYHLDMMEINNTHPHVSLHQSLLNERTAQPINHIQEVRQETEASVWRGEWFSCGMFW